MTTYISPRYDLRGWLGVTVKMPAFARHSERGKKTRRTKEEVGRQHQGMDRPGVRKGPQGSGEQRKMEKTGCKIMCDTPTTLAVKELMMMMMTMTVKISEPIHSLQFYFHLISLMNFSMYSPLTPPPPTHAHTCAGQTSGDVAQLVDSNIGPARRCRRFDSHCGKRFFSQSQLSVQTLLRCPYPPLCIRMR